MVLRNFSVDYASLIPPTIPHAISSTVFYFSIKLTPLSYRTLETHIKNIKAKLKCETLFELGYLTAKLGIQKLYPLEHSGE